MTSIFRAVRSLNLGSDEIVLSHKYSDLKPVVLFPAQDMPEQFIHELYFFSASQLQ